MGVLAAGTLLILTRVIGGPPAIPLPVLTVIPLPTPTLAPTATPVPPPTAPPTEGPQPGPGGAHSFSLGQLVTIAGTEGEGLRLRQTPGLDAAVRLVALESEVFQVVEGPVSADGYLWWHLTNPYDSSKDGWGADQYLQELDS